MASKPKCPECEEGSPGWMVSYGDMTTLLLCFFVFLLVTAKTDVGKLDSAVGFMRSSMGFLPKNRDIATQKEAFDAKLGKSGDDTDNKQIEEGTVPDIGGFVLFKNPTGIEWVEGAEKELYAISERIKGKGLIVEVRGHCSRREVELLTPASGFRDGMDLSLERARVVRDFLEQDGLDPAQLRIVGCSYHERVDVATYSEESRNMRVDVRVTKKLVRKPDTKY